MKRDGWIRECNGVWILRFMCDWESWDQNPKVWIESRRHQANGIPLLRIERGLGEFMLWTYGGIYWQLGGDVLIINGIYSLMMWFLIHISFNNFFMYQSTCLSHLSVIQDYCMYIFRVFGHFWKANLLG